MKDEDANFLLYMIDPKARHEGAKRCSGEGRSGKCGDVEKKLRPAVFDLDCDAHKKSAICQSVHKDSPVCLDACTWPGVMDGQVGLEWLRAADAIYPGRSVTSFSRRFALKLRPHTVNMQRKVLLLLALHKLATDTAEGI